MPKLNFEKREMKDKGEGEMGRKCFGELRKRRSLLRVRPCDRCGRGCAEKATSSIGFLFILGVGDVA